MNVLVIAPHPDDEAIGCGGTIRRHVVEGDHVGVVWLTSGEQGFPEAASSDVSRLREAEAEDAAAILGVHRLWFLRFPDGELDDGRVAAEAGERLHTVVDEMSPSFVYVPHPAEGHPDHEAAAAILRAAVPQRDADDMSVYGYEVWSPLTHHDLVWPIDEYIDDKLRAIRCYRSQLHQLAYDEAAEGLARYRGASAGGCRYAEVFAWL